MVRWDITLLRLWCRNRRARKISFYYDIITSTCKEIVMSYFVKFSVLLVVVVLRSPIHANEPSEYNGMLYRTSNRVLNNGIKVIILICMDGTSQYHHHRSFSSYIISVNHYQYSCLIKITHD